MHRQILGIARVCGAALLACVLSTPTFAVVISSATDTANVKAPAKDPGWLNIGRVGGGSAIYLGNRWVITAEHVDGSTLTLSDGRQFAASVGSDASIRKTGLPGTPDLRLFRLAQDPGLPAMTLAAAGPTVGAQVMMIGYGTDRTSQLRGWNLTQGPSAVQWTETQSFGADVIGYTLADTSTKRWGQNVVSNNSTFRPSDNTQVIMTRFDRNGIVFEAQATPGDSGGAVFIDGGDAGAQLAGLMITSQPLIDQPSGIVTYGTQTAMADLAFYRDEILSLVNRNEPPWQNQVNYFDINGNGRVESRDALAIINKVISNGFLDLAGPRPDGELWYDVNGDYRGNPQDLLAVFNEIRRVNGLPTTASPLAAPIASPMAVPEPSSCALAALGAAALLAARRMRRRV
jgi:hypothetical protein